MSKNQGLQKHNGLPEPEGRLTEKEREELIQRLDRESSYRKLSGTWEKITTGLLLCFTLFQMLTAMIPTMPAQQLRMTHLGFVIVLAFLLFPATMKSSREKIAWQDYLFAALFLGVVSYYLLNYEAIINRSGMYSRTDVIIGIFGIVLVMEACRRVVGFPIVVIATVFVLYAYFGKYMPGLLTHRGYSVERIATHLFYTTEGIIGLPIGTAATYIFLFILFGAFLEKTGIGQFFGRSDTIPTSHISVTFGSIDNTEPTPSATAPGEGSSQGGLVAIILAIIAIIGAAVAFVPGILPR